MRMTPDGHQDDLFRVTSAGRTDVERLGDGITLLRCFAAADGPDLLRAIDRIAEGAPFRRMETSGGFRMSVAMTNCGSAGWVSDRTGYRYDPIDPETGRPWPAMPNSFRRLAAGAAEAGGFESFTPDVCLINRYAPGTRLSLHQDRDELDFGAPIVSVSLGLQAIFLLGGLKRRDRPRRIPLGSGDIVVWGGPARKIFHGVAPVAGGTHPLTGQCRINLTFRKAR